MRPLGNPASHTGQRRPLARVVRRTDPSLPFLENGKAINKGHRCITQRCPLLLFLRFCITAPASDYNKFTPYTRLNRYPTLLQGESFTAARYSVCSVRNCNQSKGSNIAMKTMTTGPNACNVFRSTFAPGNKPMPYKI
jgi:hypothetical protein